MKTFQEYLKEAGFHEGNDAIIFKGKEIDTDTIEYDMQDYSDMIFVIDAGVKYTDGTEVEDGDMDELQELPEIVDWVSDDYNDRMADKADAYRDAQMHGDFESTMEDAFDKADRITDPVELNLYGPEDIENNSKLSAEELKDELEGDIYHLMDKASDDFTDNDYIADEMGDHFANMHLKADDKTLSCYIAMRDLIDADPADVYETGKKCLKILGAQEHQDQEQGNKGPKGRPAADAYAGGMESTVEDTGALDKFRELYRKGIGTDDAEVVLRELIEVINDDALWSDDFPQLKPFVDESSDTVTKELVPGSNTEEKIESLTNAIDDKAWMDEFAEHLMKRNSMTDSVELNRIKQLSGASTDTSLDETYDDDDDFYEAYGEMWWNEDDDPIDEAEYQGRKVKLGKPMAGDVKKFKVYVKDPKTGNVKKVNFGHGGSSVKGKSMRIRKNNPKARKSFRARHNCANPGPRTKARYWSCRKW